MAITINESTTFLICDERGDVQEWTEDGLYAEDTRFLSRYQLRLGGLEPIVLAADTVDYHTAEHFLTNPELEGVPGSSLGIVRRRRVGEGMRDELTIVNYGDDEAACALELFFDADFAEIFDVKRSTRVDKEAIRAQGVYEPWVEDEGRVIRLCYERDGFHRELVVRLSEPIALDPGHCSTELRLPPRAEWRLTIACTLVVTQHTAHAPHVYVPAPALEPERAEPRHATLVSRAPALFTPTYPLGRGYTRAVHDFSALRLRGEKVCEGAFVVAAGIPWYMALFGRDSLIASYQALPIDPEIAIGVLRTLAALQGDRVDPRRAEQPGKIVHEHRFGRMHGTQRDVLTYPYYGTIDATPLFLILIAAYHRLTGDLALVRELRSNIDRALEWLQTYGDLDGDGYLEYPGKADHGLQNQGWKDSWDSVRFQDGRLAEGPIALCEVQGYAFAARLGVADLMDALGEPGRASTLRAEASTLRERFNRDFWMEERGYFAEALDGRKRRVDSITSNAGHLLWTGIADEEKARRVADQLVSPPLFSGWGVRTLAVGEGGYNPVSYHNGSVWPHDNSLIVAGLARYGFSDHAARISGALLSALGFSYDHRLPELFAGFGRGEAHEPVQYPTACRPQAWASGSIFLMLRAMVGLELLPVAAAAPALRRAADGGEAHLFTAPPFLPEGIDFIRLQGLWVGGGRTSVTLSREEGKLQRTISPWEGGTP
jgi:glycogen debranching enzyme